MEENKPVENLNPVPAPAVVPPQPVPAAPMSNPTVVSQTSKKSKVPKILLIFIPIIILVVFGVIAFFLIDKLNTPAKVKEKAVVSQPLFLSLEKSNNKIVEHVKDDVSVSDPDSLEREAAKGQDLLDSANKNKTELNEVLSKSNVAALDNYKKLIDDYLKETNKLILLETDNVTLLKAYVEPIRKYQKLTLDISGASSYLFTDPAKYVTTLNNAISQEEEIIQDLKKIQVVESKNKEGNEAFIASLESEVIFLKQMRDAVESRNTSSIATAEKEFTESSQQNSKELNRIADELENNVDEINDKLESLSESIKEEYSGLKGQYNF